MEYNCKYCNYTSLLKGNYKKHLNTSKHILNVKKYNMNVEPTDNNKFICNLCDKEFASNFSLKRHKEKYCILRDLNTTDLKVLNETKLGVNNIILEDKNKKLEVEVKKYKDEVADLEYNNQKLSKTLINYKKYYKDLVTEKDKEILDLKDKLWELENK